MSSRALRWLLISMTWKFCEWPIASTAPRSDKCDFRTGTSAENDEKLLWRADKAMVQVAQSSVTTVSPPKCESMVMAAPIGCDTLEKLVELRILHQTQRAAGSVRSQRRLGTQQLQDVHDVATSVTVKKQKLCTQMADVLQRLGTGLERSKRWRSAPGTMDAAGVSELNGNSANAEVAAKNRVKAVSYSA